MPITALYVNDIDLSRYDLWVNVPRGWYDKPSVNNPGVSVLGGAGTLVSSEDLVVGERQLTVTGTLISTSVALAQANWDSIAALLDGGPSVSLRFATQNDREIREAIPLTAMYQPLNTKIPGGDVEMVFVCPNPHKLARLEDQYVLVPGNAAVPIAVGSAPSRVTMQILGPQSGTLSGNVTVTYRDASGIPHQVFTLNSISLTVGQYYLVDNWQIWKVDAAGNRTKANTLMPTTSHFITVDSGDAVAGASPTLESTGATVRVFVERAWR
jgi:hypothetical protein